MMIGCVGPMPGRSAEPTAGFTACGTESRATCRASARLSLPHESWPVSSRISARDGNVQRRNAPVGKGHPPGDAQGDFGEALVVIGGVEQKGHFMCVDLPHSDDSFVAIFPAENTEAFCEGHNQAFAPASGSSFDEKMRAGPPGRRSFNNASS